MRLSEAMMLGEVMMPRNDGGSWFGDEAPDWNDCGCAIGRAWFAVGRSFDDWITHGFGIEWPWLIGTTGAGDISMKFCDVLRGEITFEQLVDYVCSVEPECGECNRFECTCQKAEQAAEEVHAVIS